MTDENTIMAANAAFYTAFAVGDVEAMARLWADDEFISCIHPGWPAIVGRTAVVASWREILLSPNRPQIACHEPCAIVVGEEGRVLCIEVIGSGALAASNHFRLVDGLWRLAHHQSGQIINVLDQSSIEPNAPPRIIH